MRIMLEGKHTDGFRFGSTAVDFTSQTQAAPLVEIDSDSSAARGAWQESGANARSATREAKPNEKMEVPEYRQDISPHMQF